MGKIKVKGTLRFEIEIDQEVECDDETEGELLQFRQDGDEDGVNNEIALLLQPTLDFAEIADSLLPEFEGEFQVAKSTK